MKFTALIPDELVKDVKHCSSGKNITESIIIAFKEWLSFRKVIKLNKGIERSPLVFHEFYSAHAIRKINRSR